MGCCEPLNLLCVLSNPVVNQVLVPVNALRTNFKDTTMEEKSVTGKLEAQWYSVRCVFKMKKRLGSAKRYLYEERLTIWRATSFEDAIGKSEREAAAYAESTGSEYTGLAQAFHLYPAKLSSGSEVFSLMRESNLTQEKYLDRFFDTNDECQGSLE